MWIFLSNAMLSIVRKPTDQAHDTLTVRARAPGDIESVFPGASIVEGEGSDYLFRAVISRAEVAERLHSEALAIDYENFKDSVEDPLRHDAYLDVWHAMYEFQNNKGGRY